MNLLLIGAGRMGLRHLRGLGEIDGEIHVVDPRLEAEKDVKRLARECGLRAKLSFHTSLERVFLSDIQFHAAILSATARGRLERFMQVVSQRIKNVLIEKPMEQSRIRFRQIIKLTHENNVQVKCDHYRRSLPFFAGLRREGGPFYIAVSGGAFGLAVNGVHWLDFAVYLTKARNARMLFGEIETEKIASGRGPTFRDYGGRGLFAFEDGSRLFLSSSAGSSAPTIATITQPGRHCIIDQEKDLVITYERNPASTRPNYLYGADYLRREVLGIESVQLWDLTKNWISWIRGQGECHLPSLEEAMLGHELLFDLLETRGEMVFPIT